MEGRREITLYVISTRGLEVTLRIISMQGPKQLSTKCVVCKSYVINKHIFIIHKVTSCFKEANFSFHCAWFCVF